METEPYSGTVFTVPERFCARVTAYNLNMREKPNGKIIHWLYQDQTVIVTDSLGKWWKIEAYNTSGYAHRDYLERIVCRD